MARNVIITFSNGDRRTFAGVPDDATPDQVMARANREFSGLGAITQVDRVRDLSAVSPEQARNAYRRKRAEIAEKYTGEARRRALEAYDSDPDAVQLRHVAAGRPESRITPAMDVRTVNAPREGRERRDFLRSQGRQIAADRRASGEDFASGIRGKVAGLGNGIVGLGDHIEAGVDVLTGATPLRFRDQLEVRRGMKENEAAADPMGYLGGNIVGALVGGGGAGAGLRLGARGATAANIPGAAQASNFIQGLTAYERGSRTSRATLGATAARHGRNLGRMAVGGTASGTAQAIGEGADNVGQQALIGAVAGPVGGVALRAAGKSLAPVGGALASGWDAALRMVTGEAAPAASRKVTNVLQKLIEEPGQDLIARQQAMSQAVGREVPIAAALKDGDYREVVEGVVKRNDATVEKMKGHAAGQVRDFMDYMTGHVARAGRGASQEARDFAAQAGTPGSMQVSVGDLGAYRDTVMNKAMDDIGEAAVDISAAGRDEITRDALTEILRRTLPHRKDIQGILGRTAQDGVAAAWGLGDDAIRLTIREVDDVRRTLRSAASGAGNSNPANSLAYANAAKALEDVTSEAVPRYREALDAYAANSRIIEGFEAAVEGRRAEDIVSGQMRENLNSAEGAIGRALGELHRLRQGVSSNFRGAVSTSNKLAERGSLTRPPASAGTPLDAVGRPGSVTENVSPQSADFLAKTAAVENQILKRTVDAETLDAGLRASQEGAIGTQDLLYGAALSSALPMTKVRFAASLLDNLQGKVNPKVAENLTDMLFSRDKAVIQQGLNVLKAAGLGEAQVRNMIANTVEKSAGIGAQAARILGTERVPQGGGISVETADGQVVDVPNPDAEATYLEVSPPDAALNAIDSPYHGQLMELYGTMNSEYLDLVNRMLGQESGGRQFDSDGVPITSPRGATGIAQVMPDTGPEAAADAGLPWDEEAYYNDPAYNLVIGAAYLRKLLDRYDGDVARSLGAYNGGMGRVDAAVQLSDLIDRYGNDVSRIQEAYRGKITRPEVESAIRRYRGDWLSLMPQESQDYVGIIA